MRYGVFVGLWLVELFTARQRVEAWTLARERGGEVRDFWTGERFKPS